MQNAVLTFLRKNSERLNLVEFGNFSGYTTVVATPRFKASSHLIFFLLPPGSRNAALVAKVPRIAGNHRQLEIESANLARVQALKASGFHSIPKVISFEDYCGHRMLIETAVSGQTMRPSLVRRNRELCLDLGLSWLIELHSLSKSDSESAQLYSLVRTPLQKLESVVCSIGEERLLLRTREVIDEISTCKLPSVFEHGDFSSPNLLVAGNNTLGVVDWELAEPKGLPLVDLFFFLTYIAFASSKASQPKDYLAAFEQAFFGPEAWAFSYVDRYVKALALQESAVGPLFVASWVRYVAGLIARLTNHNGGEIESASDERVKWLRSNRYYLLWKYAIDNFTRLNLVGAY